MAVLQSRLILELVDKVTGPASQVSATVGRLNERIAANNQKISAMRGQFIGAAAAAVGLAGALIAPLRSAAAFESAMADVTKVVDFESAEAFQAFQQSLLAMSEIPGMPAAGDLAAIAAAAGQAGIAGADLTTFTEAAAKIGTAFDISAAESGEALAKMQTGLGLTIDEVVLLADSMNHLSNAQASSAAEILDVVRRVGASAKQYGFVAKDVSAFASAMIAAGAESEVAATSFRNMGLALSRGESATKRQKDALGDLGLEASEVARRMQQDAVGTTIDVLERIGKLPAELQAAVSNDLFGSQSRALGPLLTNLDLLRESLALVSDESVYSGSAFDEFSRRAETFGARAEAFGNGLKNIGIIIGTALFPVLTGLMDRLAPIIGALGEWAAANPRLVSGIIAAVAGLVAFRLVLVGLRLAGLMAMGGYLRTVAFGMAQIGARAAAVGSAARESARLNKALAAMQGIQASKLSQIGAALRGIAFATTGLSAATLGPIGIAIAAVAGAGYLLWQNWDAIRATARGVSRAVREALAPALDALRPILEPLGPHLERIGRGFKMMSDAIGKALGWIGDLFSDIGNRNVLTDEQEKNTEDRAYRIARAVIDGMAAVAPALLGIGRDAIQALWDGMKERFESMMAWLSGIGTRIRNAMPSLPSFLGGGEGVQERAAGGAFGRGVTLTGERGPELRYNNRGGFIAHNRALQDMLDMAGRAMIPQPQSLRPAMATARGSGGPINVTFGDIVVQGGSNASPDDLRRAFGREATAALRTHFSDMF